MTHPKLLIGYVMTLERPSVTMSHLMDYIWGRSLGVYAGILSSRGVRFGRRRLSSRRANSLQILVGHFGVESQHAPKHLLPTDVDVDFALVV